MSKTPMLQTLREEGTVPLWSGDESKVTAARVLNVKSKDAIYRMGREGAFPTVRLGRTVRASCPGLLKLLTADEAA